jgi:rubrerythrin
VGHVTGDRHHLTLSGLREEPSADLTIRNLMQALTLTYELRARYRVFEFEAAQEGAGECAALFAALSEAEGEQVKALMQGLRERLAAAEHASPGPDSRPVPPTARRLS